MQAGTLRALEFDRVVEAVRGFAQTPLGDQRLAGLAPSIDPQKVSSFLASTSEAVRYIDQNGTFPLRASSELLPGLDALAIEGRALEPMRLLAIASFLDSIEETRAAIRRMARSFPLLDQAAGSVASFKGEILQIRQKIDPSGAVVDHASAELKSIRERLRKQRARLRGTLESYLRGKETARFLQDQVVMERNGRYVIVVKAEHRSSIPGIVHGASTSGASLFLEPLSTVDINNDIVALEEQESDEVHRILLALSDAFRSRALDLKRTIDAATELDVVHAKARFSDSIGGIEPAISRDGAFEVQAARHPLLKAPVPITLRILPPATALLITGPNTGGKTVALKTAGLLALMAQAGLRIPAADGSRLPVYRAIFADIGDEQSIDANLSTFSGHIANIAAMDEHLTPPALVLLDEIGSGTDPVEGGALGVAIVDHFRRRGATVIATSHYDTLKTYAVTADGVESSAFGFDAQTFAPTYQLMYGSTGRSLALEIAGRLGLAAAIVTAARQNLTTREAQLAEQLAKIDQDVRALEHEHRLAKHQREAMDAAEARLREREEALKQREQQSQRRLAEELEAEVRRARREIDGVIAGLKTQAEGIARAAQGRGMTTSDTGTARREAVTAVETVMARALEPASGGASPCAVTSPGRMPLVGDRVSVGPLGLEGIVTSVHDTFAEVDVRGKRMRAGLHDLQVIGGAPVSAGRVDIHVELNAREPQGGDLNVVGCTVDEAIARADRFLDQSLLADQRVVRVIHGLGTGQLKRALTGFLEQHPLVARLTTAAPEQGGNGVTVVELKD